MPLAPGKGDLESPFQITLAHVNLLLQLLFCSLYRFLEMSQLLFTWIWLVWYLLPDFWGLIFLTLLSPSFPSNLYFPRSRCPSNLVSCLISPKIQFLLSFCLTLVYSIWLGTLTKFVNTWQIWLPCLWLPWWHRSTGIPGDFMSTKGVWYY